MCLTVGRALEVGSSPVGSVLGFFLLLNVHLQHLGPGASEMLIFNNQFPLINFQCPSSVSDYRTPVEPGIKLTKG